MRGFKYIVDFLDDTTSELHDAAMSIFYNTCHETDVPVQSRKKNLEGASNYHYPERVDLSS